MHKFSIVGKELYYDGKSLPQAMIVKAREATEFIRTPAQTPSDYYKKMLQYLATVRNRQFKENEVYEALHDATPEQLADATFVRLRIRKTLVPPDRYIDLLAFVHAQGGIEKVVEQYLSSPQEVRRVLAGINKYGMDSASYFFEAIAPQDMQNRFFLINPKVVHQLPNLDIHLNSAPYKRRGPHRKQQTYHLKDEAYENAERQLLVKLTGVRQLQHPDGTLDRVLASKVLTIGTQN
jgi:hypothetical protein